MKYMVAITTAIVILGTAKLAQAKAYEPPRVGVLVNASYQVHEQVKLRYQLTLPNLASATLSSSSVAGIQWTPHQAFSLQFLFGGTHQPGDNTFIVSLRPFILVKRFSIFALFNYSVNFQNLFHFIQAGHPITEYLGLSLVSEGVTKFRDVTSSWVAIGPSVDVKFGKHVAVSAINMLGIERGRQYYVFRAYLQFNF